MSTKLQIANHPGDVLVRLLQVLIDSNVATMIFQRYYLQENTD